MGDNDAALNDIAAALNQLNSLQIRNSNIPQVRSVPCHSYTIGQDFISFCDYFCENVRTSYNYPLGDLRLDEAFCTWIGAKLEMGPTLNIYSSLPAATKSDWPVLRAELSRLFMNEEEKQRFLANPGSFPKGSKTFLDYRNELVRLVGLYQPNLSQVPSEYQRQLVERFICGLNDPELQQKLRFHCRRDKMTIDHAYEYAVDYESSKVTGEVDLSKSLAACAHVSSMAASRYTSAIRPPRSKAVCGIQTSAEVDQVELNAVAIEELRAGQAELEESFMSFQQQVEEESQEFRSYVESKFDRLEALILSQHHEMDESSEFEEY